MLHKFSSCRRRPASRKVPRQPCVYILASKPNGTIYIGVTSDVIKRVWEHKHELVPGFTKRYKVHRLVYFELHQSMREAITRERQLKEWHRPWKIRLIAERNPEWRDLWSELTGQGRRSAPM
ncbi:MAG: GIY-YIG nuclease family protein [Nevskiales bacterium]